MKILTIGLISLSFILGIIIGVNFSKIEKNNQNISLPVKIDVPGITTPRIVYSIEGFIEKVELKEDKIFLSIRNEEGYIFGPYLIANDIAMRSVKGDTIKVVGAEDLSKDRKIKISLTYNLAPELSEGTITTVLLR